MNVVKKIEQFDINNVVLCETIKNNIINDGKFSRIIYSTHNLTFNGIYLLVKLNHITCNKYYSKYKCEFNVNDHSELINNIKIIEDSLLNKFNIAKKKGQFKINETLKTGNVKIHTSVENCRSCCFVLKISGVWETEDTYGLTYKFCKINDDITTRLNDLHG
tara:strand:- start:757 stop:1242 length:486 start_codon:yes stop_codon:yes gene_type:complete